jgi:hypothetical protein
MFLFFELKIYHVSKMMLFSRVMKSWVCDPYAFQTWYVMESNHFLHVF